MDSIKADNTRLKEENAALIRVISKLSKWKTEKENLQNKQIICVCLRVCALECFFSFLVLLCNRAFLCFLSLSLSLFLLFFCIIRKKLSHLVLLKRSRQISKTVKPTKLHFIHHSFASTNLDSICVKKQNKMNIFLSFSFFLSFE